MTKLSTARITAELRQLPAWRRQRQVITCTYQFRDFVAAMRFVNRVARIAEAHWHHPDISIQWNKVTLTLTSHDAGGLTAKDFQLAAQCDAAATPALYPGRRSAA
jgi:4a-hydroxytetrahydrobiopterin dehydratase